MRWATDAFLNDLGVSWNNTASKSKRIRDKKIIDIQRNPITKGSFEFTNMRRRLQDNPIIHIKMLGNKIQISRITCSANDTYTLSPKDIEFILSAIEQLWSNLNESSLSKAAQGKNIKLCIKNSDYVEVDRNKVLSLNINDNIIFHGDLHDNRRFYAMLKELLIYGKSNKLK